MGEVVDYPCMGGTNRKWGRALDRFAQWLVASGHSPNTITLRRYYLRRFAAHVPDPWEADLGHMARFLATPTWGPSTRKSARASLSVFYTWATIAGHLEVNPAVHLPRVKVPRGVPKPTPEPVLNRALAVATDRDRLMMMLGAFAGLRRAEIAGLRLDAVADVITVRGKGGHERVIPTHQRLRLAVEHERELRNQGSFGTGWRFGDPRRTPYLFPGQSGGHITAGHVGKVLARCLGDYSGHTLRHRFATRAYAGTGDIRTVQELLGHASSSTTERYVAINLDAMRRAVDAA